MKSLIVEPYTPYPKGQLLTKQIVPNWGLLIGLILLIPAIAVPLLVGEPLFLALLLIPMLALIGDYSEFGSQRPFVRKRVKLPYSFGWYDESVMKEHSLYHDKVMEYLDYLRGGGEQSDEVQFALEDWKNEAIEELKLQEKRKAKEVAEMFNLRNQLKEYRDWKKDNEHLC